MSSVLTNEVNGTGLRKGDDELPLLDLIGIFFSWSHLEVADLLCLIKHAHVEGPKACGVEPPTHDAEVVAHKHLVHPVTGEEIDCSELNVESVRGRGYGQDIILYVWDQVFVVHERKWKGMESEQPKLSFFGSHRYVD
jgi:hypothetical protein